MWKGSRSHLKMRLEFVVEGSLESEKGRKKKEWEAVLDKLC